MPLAGPDAAKRRVPALRRPAWCNPANVTRRRTSSPLTTPVAPTHNMRMSHLRHISVFVDEPDPGHFYWVLHESTEDASVWIDMGSSTDAFTSWTVAFEAGTVALYRLVVDKRTGPRAPGEDEDAAPVG